MDQQSIDPYIYPTIHPICDQVLWILLPISSLSPCVIKNQRQSFQRIKEISRHYSAKSPLCKEINQILSEIISFKTHFKTLLLEKPTKSQTIKSLKQAAGPQWGNKRAVILLPLKPYGLTPNTEESYAGPSGWPQGTKKLQHANTHTHNLQVKTYFYSKSRKINSP